MATFSASKRNITIRALLILLVGLCSLGVGVSEAQEQDCRTVAAAPPVLTFGGPETVQPGEDEAAFGAAFGGTLFDCTHQGGSGWFGRWRRGLTRRFDLGADLQVVQHNDKGTATLKVAGRWQLRPRVRLEVGVGVADDSDGKSLNGDFGLTVGQPPNDRRWARFASIRVTAARGYPGNVCCFGGASGTNVPPTDYQLIGTLGATGRISDNARFVYEGGFGGIRAHFSDRTATGRVFYLSLGVLFRIREKGV